MLLELALLLIFAKLFGEVTERIGITALVGQVIAGIVLGPMLLWVDAAAFFEEFVILGIVFILFIAGLGVRFEDVRENVYTASGIALLGGLLSFVFGFAVGLLVFDNMIIGVAIGIIFISTGNGVLFSILEKIGGFRTRIGKMIVATTAADDIVGILALSFFTFFIVHGSVEINELFKLFLVAIGFYIVILTVGARIISKIMDYTGKLVDEQILFSIPIAVVFMLAVMSQEIGLGIAAGAFLAGMAMAKNKFTDEIIKPKVKVVGDGFVIPIFYAIVGTLLTLQGIDILLVILLTAAAVLGKYVGSFWSCAFFKIRGDDRRLLGIMMTPRGDYNIAVAQIALSLGVFAGFAAAYSSIIFAILLTVIIAPILLRIFMGHQLR